MLNRILLVVLLMAVYGNLLFAQEYTQEFGIRSDNDAYLWYGQDRYYTNGLFLFYRKALDQRKISNTKLEKAVYEVSVGQQMYTPFSGYVPERELQDRPFAGYLYAKGKVNLLYADEQVWKVGLALGTVGPNSFSREAQTLLHQTVGLYSTSGWDYQIKNALALNLQVNYSTLLYRPHSHSFDFSLDTHLDLGTTFTGLGAGLLFRTGDINPFYHSAYHEASISNHSRKEKATEREFYFYAKPQLNVVAYDATIQGGLFADNSPVTFDSRPLVFEQKLGINYTSKRFTLDYHLTFRSKEVQSVARPHQYGGISAFYRF